MLKYEVKKVRSGREAQALGWKMLLQYFWNPALNLGTNTLLCHCWASVNTWVIPSRVLWPSSLSQSSLSSINFEKLSKKKDLPVLWPPKGALASSLTATVPKLVCNIHKFCVMGHKVTHMLLPQVNLKAFSDPKYHN